MDDKEFKKLMKEHDSVLEAVEKIHKSLLTDKQKNAFDNIQKNFLDNLDRDENGNVKMNDKNISLLNQIDDAFDQIAKQDNTKILKQLTTNITNIVGYNQKYFSAIDGEAKVLKILPKVQNAMSGWLGIKDGTPQKNGFIDQLVKDDTAKVAVKNLAMKIVIGQQGLENAKGEMKLLIEGNNDKLGAFERHHKTFANDLYSQIDRATSNVVRQDLKMVFAVYEGGLIETSRPFCEEHNGKVFHISEILKFKPEVGIPPNYEPIHDLGGYNCRHHLNWISKAMAKAMGKDVSKYEDEPIKPEVKEKPAKEPAKKEEVVPKTEDKPIPTPKAFERRPIDEKFDDIQVEKIQTFTVPKNWKEMEEKIILIDQKAKEAVKEFQSKIEAEQLKFQIVKNRYLKASSVERREMVKEYNGQVKVLNEVVKKSQAISNKAQKEIEKINNDEFLRMVKDIKNPPSEVQWKFNSSSDKNSRVPEMFDVFKKLTGKFELRDNYVFNTNLKVYKNRANYVSANGQNLVNVMKTESKGVILHELIHSVENNNFAMKQAVEFLERRTAGNPIRKLNEINRAYDSRELFKEGGFFNPYVGKIYKLTEAESVQWKRRTYKGYSATEVLTMGVQRMYENPFKFYKEDREHFEFIHTLFFK